jgi:hypothetical protein
MLDRLTPTQRGRVTQLGASFQADTSLKVHNIEERNPTNLPEQPYLDQGYVEVRFYAVSLDDRLGHKDWTYILVKDKTGTWLIADWGV